MWHKFYGEDVVCVASLKAGGEGEVGVGRVDVDAVVIGAGGEKVAGGGPSGRS